MIELDAYARLFGFDTLEDRTDLVHFVKVCDATWLAEMQKRRK